MIEYQYFKEPTPHIYLPQLLPPATYSQLRFPTIEHNPRGRTGRDLYPGEPRYDDVVSSPGWRDLHGMFTSDGFVRWVMTLFADDMARLGCRVDPKQARFEPFVESRETMLTSPDQISDRDSHSIFARFDIQAADDRYRSYVHLDHPRRLLGGVLFCSDHRDEGLEGGEFALYRDRVSADDRRCLWPKVEKTFPVTHNTGVLFLNSNHGFHGSRPIRKLSGLRKVALFFVSSHRPAWTGEATSTPRERAFRMAGHLTTIKRRCLRIGR